MRALALVPTLPSALLFPQCTPRAFYPVSRPVSGASKSRSRPVPPTRRLAHARIYVYINFTSVRQCFCDASCPDVFDCIVFVTFRALDRSLRAGTYSAGWCFGRSSNIRPVNHPPTHQKNKNNNKRLVFVYLFDFILLYRRV